MDAGSHGAAECAAVPIGAAAATQPTIPCAWSCTTACRHSLNSSGTGIMEPAASNAAWTTVSSRGLWREVDRSSSHRTSTLPPAKPSTPVVMPVLPSSLTRLPGSGGASASSTAAAAPPPLQSAVSLSGTGVSSRGIST